MSPGSSNLILTGFMGTGKTTVGRQVARRLGWPFLDMDEEIAARAGKSISQIFRQDGQGSFRQLEAMLCQELAAREGLVIATGGGALVDPVNRARMTARGTVICLTCSVDEILRRMAGDQNRPLLQVPDPRAEAERLLASRQDAYADLPWQVDTGDRSVEQVADQVLCLAGVASLPVQYPGGHTFIHVGDGLLDQVGLALHSAGVPATGRVAVVSNPIVAPLYLSRVMASLRMAGFDPFSCTVPDGEMHKTLATVASLYQEFLGGGLDRGGTVLSLGGGVTGDMVGFAAASYMRGVRFAQLPTTLLAMVDASVGGKTGVDLPQGKNLVGAFKQAVLVLIDPQVLATLPQEELRSGIAETLKHGVIADPGLFAMLAGGPAGRVTGEQIVRAVQVKIDVVEEDPFESGRRAVLNLGHTVGHALEKVSSFQLRHGEAVGIGMVAAAKLAADLDHAQPELAGEIAAALDAWQLPTTLPGYSLEAVVSAMAHDKKRRGTELRWVLPRSVGEVLLDDQVPLDLVRDILIEMGAAK